jgi:excisionase family DNA binding protein
MLTLAEAAEQLGLHPDVLRRQIHRGKLKGRKVGPIWTITERELERYRKENQRESQKD